MIILINFLADNDSEHLPVPGSNICCTQHLATLHMVRILVGLCQPVLVGKKVGILYLVKGRHL